jgi:hypothetical protein
MSTKKIQPKDVDSYPSLKDLAQFLCDEPNHVDGILIVRPNHQIPDFLEVCTERNFQGVNLKALSGRIRDVIKFSEDLIFSDGDFVAGETLSVLYEFENLAFVIYSLREENFHDVYLVLVNTKDKDLGAFNANRGRVYAQMASAIKRIGQLGLLTN